MARIGINPARGKTINDRPAHITIAIVTYLPNLEGYFKDRFQILQLVLASLWAHTEPSYDLFIFDNGSCSPVVDHLRQFHKAGQIDYLILSHKNIGKIDAFRIIFNAAPGEVIAYSDDDILFYPGWLEAHLKILNTFPRVGMVSGVPVRNAGGHARESLENITAKPVPGLTSSWERRIPDIWEVDWAISTGRDPIAHLESTRDHRDLVLRMENPTGKDPYEAIGTANHFQFVTRKHIILQALPPDWTGKLMGSMIELDEAVDELGFLRLSTVDRYTRHLGNILSEDIKNQAQSWGLIEDVDAQKISISNAIGHQRRKAHWSMRIPGGRRVLSKIYSRLFDILYG